MSPRPTLSECYLITFVAGVTDLLLIVLMGHSAYFLRFGGLRTLDDYLRAMPVVALVVVIYQVRVGSYLSWRDRSFFWQLARVVYVGWLMALSVSSVLAVLLHVAQSYSCLWCGTMLVIALGLASAARLGISCSCATRARTGTTWGLRALFAFIYDMAHILSSPHEPYPSLSHAR